MPGRPRGVRLGAPRGPEARIPRAARLESGQEWPETGQNDAKRGVSTTKCSRFVVRLSLTNGPRLAQKEELRLIFEVLSSNRFGHDAGRMQLMFAGT